MSYPMMPGTLVEVFHVVRRKYRFHQFHLLITVDPKFYEIYRIEIRNVDREFARLALPSILSIVLQSNSFLWAVSVRQCWCCTVAMGSMRRYGLQSSHACTPNIPNTHCDFGMSSAPFVRPGHDDDAWWNHWSSSHGWCEGHLAPVKDVQHVDGLWSMEFSHESLRIIIRIHICIYIYICIIYIYMYIIWLYNGIYIYILYNLYNIIHIHYVDDDESCWFLGTCRGWTHGNAWSSNHALPPARRGRGAVFWRNVRVSYGGFLKWGYTVIYRDIPLNHEFFWHIFSIIHHPNIHRDSSMYGKPHTTLTPW